MLIYDILSSPILTAFRDKMNGMAILAAAYTSRYIALVAGICAAARPGTQEAGTRWQEGRVGYSDYIFDHNRIGTISVVSS